MKKLLALLLLFTTIIETTTAQNKTEDIFEVPEGYLSNRFSIDLGKGNTMQLGLSAGEDVARFINIDSILRVFFKDIASFKDSLSDERIAKRIDYLTDRAGRKKLRIRITPPNGSAFLIRPGEISALKTAQDTVNLIGIINEPTRRTLHGKFSDIRYYRISFFVNQLSDLQAYEGMGLNDKVAVLEKSTGGKWVRDKEGNWRPGKGDKSIFALNPNGTIEGSGDMLTTNFSANIQNYKSYFVPSVSLGIAAIFNNGKSKTEIGVAWEPNFIFEKDAAGKLQTFRNDFITLGYQHKRIMQGKQNQYLTFNPNLSFSYLLKRQGDYFDKNAFRLGIGEFKLLKDKISIEPVLYFNDFFRHVTPGIRIGVSF